MTTEGGYDEIVVEDFHTVFLEELEKLAKLKEEFDQQAADLGEAAEKDFNTFVSVHLFSVLCNHEKAQYIIMFVRFLAATYLKQNAILYEDFIGESMATFC